MKRKVLAFAMLGTLALAGCAHKAPVPVAPVAVIAPVPPPIDRSIGTATMLADKSIVMKLRTGSDTGSGILTQKLKPGDMQYALVIKQLGGLKPGQTKKMTQYPGE